MSSALSPPPSTPSRPVSSVVAALLTVGMVLAAWSNSFTSPFHFDDHASILDNATIRSFWPATWLRPPATAGETVGGRPVLNFTFAINYVFGRLDVRGFHAVNVVIHALAALALFGLTRRTLSLRTDLIPLHHGTGFALAVALLWALHPLQVESVTYLVQRAESLAGLFSLLTLYGFVRGVQASSRAWFGFSFVACLLGIGTKETVAVMPVIVVLYDWTFAAGSLRGVWKTRRGVHLALFATWLPLAVLVFGMGGSRGGTFSFTAEGFVGYWVAQLKAITWYLRLTFWPSPLVFDRAFFRIERLAEAMPYALVILSLLGATVWSLRRHRAVGFLGGCFFILLAPTSLMPGTLQVIVEHRMYLALIAPVTLFVALVWKFDTRVALGIAAGAVLALGAVTFSRNQVYRTELSLWQDTAAKSPDNPRAHYNLGVALARAQRSTEAADSFRRALALQPNHAFALFQLGKAALLERRWIEAAEYFETAVAADSRYVDARINLGQALGELGRIDEAIIQYEAALAIEPSATDVQTNLGAALVTRGRLGEAEQLLRAALAAKPNQAEAHYHLGMALAKKDTAAAEQEFTEAIQLKPGLVAAHFALGNLRARLQRLAEAMDSYHEVLRLEPAHVPARNNLANCQLVTGRLYEAIANYEAVLRARPGDPTAIRNLTLAREQLR